MTDVHRLAKLNRAVLALIADLDREMNALYPAESNHLTDPLVLVTPPNRFYITGSKDAPTGTGALLVHDHYGEVKRIYVSPAARGTGLSRLLLDQIETDARILGLEGLKLETGPAQPAALALFHRHGFRPCDAFGDYPADDPNSVFLEKTLSER